MQVYAAALEAETAGALTLYSFIFSCVMSLGFSFMMTRNTPACDACHPHPNPSSRWGAAPLNTIHSCFQHTLYINRFGTLLKCSNWHLTFKSWLLKDVLVCPNHNKGGRSNNLYSFLCSLLSPTPLAAGCTLKKWEMWDWIPVRLRKAPSLASPECLTPSVIR